MLTSDELVLHSQAIVRCFVEQLLCRALNSMAENPYQAPHSSCDQGALPGVTVLSRIPLHITAECLFQLDVRADRLVHRIQRAAEVCMFSVIARRDDRFILHRGSNWHAIYTFDIRKIPTVATVTVQSHGQIHVVFRCQSIWQISTSGDATRLLRELTLFQTACLAGG
jgi:hypothetical protein